MGKTYMEYSNIKKYDEFLVLTDKDKRIEMGKKSKELSHDYSEEKIMNQWKELFKNLVKR